MRTSFAFIVILAAAVLASASTARAVGLSSFDYGNIITVSMTPELPAPGDTVRFEVDSMSFDINRSTIAWTVNGKTERRGVGEKQFELVAGKAGTAYVVTVDITSPGGLSTRKTTTITPLAIDILWQARTTVPPFYKGKAMYTDGSDIDIVAVPHIFQGGKEIGASNLVFEWRVDGLVLGSESGYGRNVLRSPENLLNRPLRVEVIASTMDGRVKGKGQTVIRPAAPKVIVYENDPLLGIMNQKALAGTVEMKSKEIGVVAYPLFFTPGSWSDISYKWTLNNDPITSEPPNRIIFRNESDAEGESLIMVKLEHAKKDLQFADTRFNIRFGKNQERPASL